MFYGHHVEFVEIYECSISMDLGMFFSNLSVENLYSRFILLNIINSISYIYSDVTN